MADSERCTVDELLAKDDSGRYRNGSDALDVALEAVCVEFANTMHRISDQVADVRRIMRSGAFSPRSVTAVEALEALVEDAKLLQRDAERIDFARLTALAAERRERATPVGQAVLLLTQLDTEDNVGERANIIEELLVLDETHGEPITSLLRSEGIPAYGKAPDLGLER